MAGISSGLIEIKEIFYDESFYFDGAPDIDNELLAREQKALSSIFRDMFRNGYDHAFPVVLWDKSLIDGHIRLKAAKLVGFKKVPFVQKWFNSESEAIQYIIDRQVLCRNSMNQDVIKQFEKALHKRLRLSDTLEWKLEIIRSIISCIEDLSEGFSGPHSRECIEEKDSLLGLLRFLQSLPSDHKFFILGYKFHASLLTEIKSFGFNSRFPKQEESIEDFIQRMESVLSGRN